MDMKDFVLGVLVGIIGTTGFYTILGFMIM